MKKTLIIFSVIALCSCTTLNIENSKLIDEKQKSNNEERDLDSVKQEESLLTVFKNQNIEKENCKMVFAPEKVSLKKFYKDNRSQLIFTKQTLLKVNNEKSLLQDSFGEENEVENSLIIPIKENEIVEKGDFLIIISPKTKTLSFVKVVDAKNPKQPLVKDLDDPNNKKNELLTENSFIKIEQDFSKGAILVVKEGDNYFKEFLLCEQDGAVLTLSENFKLNIRQKQNILPVNLKRKYIAGEDVFFTQSGKYTPAVIKSVDNEEATAVILFNENGKNKEKVLSTIHITKNLE